MTIPVSSVVNVSAAIGAQFPQRRGFGVFNLITSETGVIGVAERLRKYTSLDAVIADWGSTSEAGKAATTYYSQRPQPIDFYVSVRFDTDQAAQLRGGSVTDVTPFLAPITDGSFTISIDGVAQDITGINFTGDTDAADVAVTIQTALQAVASGGFTAATCVYADGRFYIDSGTTGVTSTISFLTEVSPSTGTDISSLLQMRQGEGVKTDGFAGETVTESLDAIQLLDDSWYGFGFTKEVRDDVIINTEGAVLAAATWAEARVKTFWNTTNDLDVLDSVTTNDIASLLQDQGFSRTYSTFSSYPDQYPSVSSFARMATVNFENINSTITLKFKQLPSITVETLNSNQKAVLDSKNCNAYISVGGSPMVAESVVADGKFIDEIVGVDWLTDAIQINVFGYLYTRTTKVAYTDDGIAALEQQIIAALDQGVVNGLITAGETIDGEFLPLGYKVENIAVADVSPSDKAARQYNGFSVTVLGAGAIHGVQINLVFER